MFGRMFLLAFFSMLSVSCYASFVAERQLNRELQMLRAQLEANVNNEERQVHVLRWIPNYVEHMQDEGQVEFFEDLAHILRDFFDQDTTDHILAVFTDAALNRERNAQEVPVDRVNERHEPQVNQQPPVQVNIQPQIHVQPQIQVQPQFHHNMQRPAQDNHPARGGAGGGVQLYGELAGQELIERALGHLEQAEENRAMEARQRLATEASANQSKTLWGEQGAVPTIVEGVRVVTAAVGAYNEHRKLSRQEEVEEKRARDAKEASSKNTGTEKAQSGNKDGAKATQGKIPSATMSPPPTCHGKKKKPGSPT